MLYIITREETKGRWPKVRAVDDTPKGRRLCNAVTSSCHYCHCKIPTRVDSAPAMEIVNRPRKTFVWKENSNVDLMYWRYNET